MKEKSNKKQKENKIHQENGITLVALIITIIVLVILAAVTISTLVQDQFIDTAMKGAENYAVAQSNEVSMLNGMENTLNGAIKTIKAINGYEIMTETQTINGEKIGKSQNPTIPKGFKPVNTSTSNWGNGDEAPSENAVNNGLVIEDETGNQFVWIPVTETLRTENLNETVTFEKKEYDDMKASVEKYGGFYIGRYEAGSTTERKGWQENGNSTTTMVIKRDQYPYNYVGWGKKEDGIDDYSEDMIYTDEGLNENNGKGAVYLCRHMYDTKSVGVKSCLCYGSQWTAILNFLKKANFNVDTDSSSWGNFYGSVFDITRNGVKSLYIRNDTTIEARYLPWNQIFGSFGSANTGNLLTTGATDRNMANNIYDIAGNCAEWTMELAADNIKRFAVGSSSLQFDKPSHIASYSRLYGETNWGINLSFRPALYIIDD